MPNYSNGKETRERIINACKTLFYEKGYLDTTYTDVAKLADVKPGSIAYHFGSLRAISTYIDRQVVSDAYDALSTTFQSVYDDTDLIPVLQCLPIYVFFADEKYRRYTVDSSAAFITEKDFEKTSVFYDLYDTRIFNHFKRVYCEVFPHCEHRKIDFYFSAISGMETTIWSFFAKYIDEFTVERAILYYFDVFYSFFRFDNTHIKEKVIKFIEIINQLEIIQDRITYSVQLK